MISKKFNDALLVGFGLKWKDIPPIEKKVEKNPFDYVARIKLLGYYMTGDNEPFARHYIWFVENSPEHEILSDVQLRWHGEKEKNYRRIKKHWKKLLSIPGAQPKTFSNAANFFASCEPEISVSYVESAKRKDPWNTIWQYELIGYYRTYSIEVGSRKCKQILDKALKCSKFLERRNISDEDKADVLRSVAQIAINGKKFEIAEEYAKKLGKFAQRQRTSEARVKSIHFSKILLGEIAYEKGFIDAACHHLCDSSRVKLPSIFGSFAPDFGLASRLLLDGRVEEVIYYLENCKKIYFRVDHIDEWLSDIRAGKEPSGFGVFDPSESTEHY